MAQEGSDISAGTRPDPWPPDLRSFRHRLRARVRSTDEALSRTVRRVRRIARKCGCLEDRRADLEIALREAMANAMIHGHEKIADKRIALACWGDPDRGILILVRDQGAGFDPRGVPDPRTEDRKHLDHGRGLLLMRELMDYVEFRKGGREVVLFKACDPA